MRIHPHERHLAAQTLAHGARRPRHGADGDAVVASQSEHAAAGGGVSVDLRADLLGDGGDGEGVLHVAVRGVGGGEEVRVGVDCVVVVQGVA